MKLFNKILNWLKNLFFAPAVIPNERKKLGFKPIVPLKSKRGWRAIVEMENGQAVNRERRKIRKECEALGITRKRYRALQKLNRLEERESVLVN